MSTNSLFKRLPLALFTASVLISIWTTPAFATAGVPLSSPFELDGNAKPDVSGGTDWSNVAVPIGNGFTGIKPDLFNDKNDDNFSQGGSKDERDTSKAGITKTFWLNTKTTPPDKDDLEHAYAVAYNVANTSGGTDKVIYFGADRFSNSGDSAIGFWFFKNKISENSDGTFSGVHTDGDVLVTSDFRQGGGVSVLNVFVWQGDTDPAHPLLLLQSSDNGGKADPFTGVFCLDPVAPNTVSDACAISNTKAVDAPWSYFFKGDTVTASKSFPQGTFFEGGININELLKKSECFASFLAMTRTSASTTAQLKDYVLGNFEACQASVRTEIHDKDHNPIISAPAQTTVHDKVFVTGNINTKEPSGTVTFTFLTGTDDCDASHATSTTTQDQTLKVETPFTQTTAGVSSAETSDFGPLAGGKYSFYATYKGDSTYPEAGPSDCEPLTINTQPVEVTTDIQDKLGKSVLDHAVPAGTTVLDVVTIKGNLSIDPTGDVKITLYKTANCTETAADPKVTETVTIADDKLADGITQVSSTSTTTVTTSLTDGTFVSYTAEYLGDGNYSPATGAVCEPICSFKTTDQQLHPPTP